MRNINEPLVRGVPITMEGKDDETMVLILYEKLPELFCFACGRIGHHIKDCDLSLEEKMNPKFGTWLRAGRGIDYRRVTYGPRLFAAKENPRGPRPPPRGNLNNAIVERTPVDSGNNTVVEDTTSAQNNCHESTKEDLAEGEATNAITINMEVDSNSLLLNEQIQGGNRGLQEGRWNATSGRKEMGREEEGAIGEAGEKAEEKRVGRGAEGGEGVGQAVRQEGGREELERLETRKNMEGMQKESKKFSPKKLKKNPSGKGWKRMARSLGHERIEGDDSWRNKVEQTLGKRREGGDGEKAEDSRVKKMRVMEKDGSANEDHMISAEAAKEQPRREI